MIILGKKKKSGGKMFSIRGRQDGWALFIFIFTIQKSHPAAAGAFPRRHNKKKKWMCKTEKGKKIKSIQCSLDLGAPPPGAGSRRWHSQSKDELLRDEKAAHKDLIA